MNKTHDPLRSEHEAMQRAIKALAAVNETPSRFAGLFTGRVVKPIRSHVNNPARGRMRNQPCPCGSKLKAKHCHGRNRSKPTPQPSIVDVAPTTKRTAPQVEA